MDFNERFENVSLDLDLLDFSISAKVLLFFGFQEMDSNEIGSEKKWTCDMVRI